MSLPVALCEGVFSVNTKYFRNPDAEAQKHFIAACSDTFLLYGVYSILGTRCVMSCLIATTTAPCLWWCSALRPEEAFVFSGSYEHVRHTKSSEWLSVACTLFDARGQF